MIEILDPKQRAEMEGFRFPEEPQKAEPIKDKSHTLTEEGYIAAQKQIDPNFSEEEFEFHQARFENKAKKREESLWGKVMDIDDPKTAKAFAHEEALRDNADFEKRRTQEFKEWHRMLEIVVENLKKKRDDPEKEGKKIRPLLLILGGGMQGPYGAGQVIALGRMGFRDKFDTVVGISAGAADAAYFLSANEESDKQTLLGTSLYYKELATKKFLNFLRLKQIMNVGYAVGLMKEGEKALDTDAIIKGHSEFYVQATNSTTKEPELINGKTDKQGVVQAIEASMALPWVYGKEIEVDDGKYVDGAFEPVPIQKVIERFNPTDVLILPNMSYDNTDTRILSKAKNALIIGFAKMLPRLGSLPLAEKVLRAQRQTRQAFEYIRNNYKVNVGILYPPDLGLTQVGTDSEQIQAGVIAAAKNTFEEFGEKEKGQNLKLL